MTYNLVELIKASGNAGVAEESFRNDVTAAGDEVNMASYRLLGSGSGAASTASIGGFSIAPAITGNGFEVNLTFGGYGTRFRHIRNNGTSSWGGFSGSGLTHVTTSWNDGTATATLGVTAPNVYDPATSETLQFPDSFVAWFDGYVAPDRPADGDPNGYLVRVSPRVTGGGIASGSTDYTFGPFSYNPDSAAFNPDYSSGVGTYTIRVNRLAFPPWGTAYDLEAHDSAAYTNQIDLFVLSYSFTTAQWYIRYRVKAEYNGGIPGAWNEYGLVTWSDPRPDV